MTFLSFGGGFGVTSIIRQPGDVVVPNPTFPGDPGTLPEDFVPVEDPFPVPGIAQDPLVCAIACNNPLVCSNPITRGVVKSICGPDCCESALAEMPIGLDPTDPAPPGFHPPATNGCLPCGPNDCKVPYTVKTGPCRGQTRFRKGRLVMGHNGAAVCVPKKRGVNYGNQAASRRATRRLKGAAREFKKIVDGMNAAAKDAGIAPKRARRSKSTCKC